MDIISILFFIVELVVVDSVDTLENIVTNLLCGLVIVDLLEKVALSIYFLGKDVTFEIFFIVDLHSIFYIRTPL